MRHSHGWWIACALGAATLGGDANIAEADEGALAAAEQGAPVVLPHGVHYRGGHYSLDVCDHDQAGYCLSHRALPDGYRPEDGVPTFGPSKSKPEATWMSPTDVLAAYDIPSASKGAGRIVALVDEPDAHAYEDVTAYRAGFKLPALPKCAGGLPDGKTPCFAQVDETGSPSSSEDCGSQGDGETGLDMAMVSAACPDCAILVVQMTSVYSGGKCNFTAANFAPALLHATQTAEKLGAAATSISFGGPEGKSDPTGYTTAGHLVLVAAGDSGYDLGEKSGTPAYPASSPDVLAVGGTNLARSGSTYTETVWNNDVGITTSGCSTEFAMPDFQSSYLKSHAGAFGGCTMRTAADLSAAASFGPGDGGSAKDGIALVNGGKWVNYWGTSASSPLVAALLTRMDLTDTISGDLGFVYDHDTTFHDVTSGDDDTTRASCSTNLCVAGEGWDGPTGIGTPDALMLAPGDADAGSKGKDGGGKDHDAGADGGAGGGAIVDAGLGGGGSPEAGLEDDSGRAPAGEAGAFGDTGPSSGGCGCRTAGETLAPSRALASLVGLAFVLLARRRRR